MKSLLISEVFLCLFALTAAIPKPEDEHKQRDVHKDISGHYINNQHNPAYDHEAFLGEEAKTFDQLPHEESSRRLGLIVDKIDKDKDGFVTKEELKDWILYVQQQYIHKNVDKQWQSHNPEDKPKLSWTEYRNMVYGSIQENENEVPNKSEEDSFSYATMLKRDRRRWSIADLDGDDALTKEEFTAFLHAEEAPHMKDVVALETMEDIDKDGDGKLSLEEYIGDMYIPNDGIDDPEWVKNEREQFTSFRDKDGDGFMDIKEVKEWVTPSDYDHAEAESRHLIFEADMDADQKLTKEEILENYNIFVGSPATDFGEALTRHDEF